MSSCAVRLRRLLPVARHASLIPSVRAGLDHVVRHQSTSSPGSSSGFSQLPPPPPPRWLSDLTARLGRCLQFGCSAAQVARAAGVAASLGRDWRGLVAGSEGFLTGDYADVDDDGRLVGPSGWKERKQVDEEFGGSDAEDHGKTWALGGLEGQRVVWGEMDSFGHVNNVTYIRYAESSRVNWITHFAIHEDPKHATEWRQLMTPKATGLILKSITTEYKFPMTYPDTISVYHKLRGPPSSLRDPTAFQLDCVVLSHRHRRASARAFEDIVVYDYARARKTALPPFAADVFAAVWDRQQRVAAAARTKVWELIAEVESLEKETWDRDDAVEDLGGRGRGG